MKTLERSSTVSARDREILAEVKEAICRLQPGATVLLYGSVARGTQGEESDYNVLALTDETMTSREKDTIDRESFGLELSQSIVVSTVYWANSEWDRHWAMPFHLEVDEDGILL